MNQVTQNLIAFAAVTLALSNQVRGDDVQLVVNANILTMSSAQPNATAMAFDNGTLLAVGDEATVRQSAGDSAEVYDLGGATVVPGFIETHDHMVMFGAVSMGYADLSPATTRDREHAIAKLRRQPLDDDGWILGFGVEPLLYDNEEGREPWIETLDAAFPDIPVFLYHNSGHAAYVNSRVFEDAGITAATETPPGSDFDKDENGNLTGFVRGRPAWMMIRGFPAVTPESTRAAAKQRASVGITTASELAITSPIMLKLIEQVTNEPDFPVRLIGGMFISMPGIENVAPTARDHENELFKLPFIKSWADGSLQGGTGALSDGYYKMQTSVESGLTTDQEGFNAQVMSMYEMGYWPALHANGDAALDMALGAIENLRQTVGADDVRPQLIHCQYVRPEQFERMVELGASCTFFSSHIYYYGDLHLDLMMGPERGNQISPLRWSIDHGLKTTMHDDAPVAPTNPMLNIWAVVNRTTRSGRKLDQTMRLTVEEALAAYTRDAAWQFGMEDQIGSLEAGKKADFVVLSADPRAVPPETIKDIRISATVMNGRLTYLADTFYSGSQ
ncbi:MAG: hypothetical protein DHS20C11_01250 [Lysobacteraceae bacterium]|nr:MAG: hypothetical protein DHS20C11_01250 [Xanthomonadaceae bacterium]